mmetsp:Transcript_21669/g.41371  ORF Transcript_21669/g.41371 Transcript_21669/m.41371 type:complete len:289 (-) Transcript_21669:90-956(-)
MLVGVYLVHFADHRVNVVLAGTGFATLNIVNTLLGETTQGAAELEWPKELVAGLERGANSEDLVNEILDTNHVFLTQYLLHDAVVGERNALFVDLAESSLVDQFLHGFKVRVSPHDVRFDAAKHHQSCLVDLDEYTVIDLPQAQQLKDLSGLRVHVINTAQADHERQLRLRFYIETTLGFCRAPQSHSVLLLLQVLLSVLLRALEDILARGLCLHLGRIGLSRLDSSPFLVALALLQHRLRNCGLRGGGLGSGSLRSSSLGGRSFRGRSLGGHSFGSRSFLGGHPYAS